MKAGERKRLAGEDDQRASPPVTGSGRKLLRAAVTFLAVRIIKATVLERVVRTDIDGFRMTIRPGVFHPKFFFSSMVLGRFISTLNLQGVKVLDMGTGSGVIGLYAAAGGAIVTAVDLSPLAVQCAQENVANLGFGSRVKVLMSDLFDSLREEEKWRYIFWNPPFYPRPWADLPEAAWNAGEDYDVIRRFAHDAPGRLSDGGEMYLVLSSEMDIQRILEFFSDAGFSPINVLSRTVLWETFHIYRFTRN
jgi:release factor glutamine methyltransferase